MPVITAKLFHPANFVAYPAVYDTGFQTVNEFVEAYRSQGFTVTVYDTQTPGQYGAGITPEVQRVELSPSVPLATAAPIAVAPVPNTYIPGGLTPFQSVFGSGVPPVTIPAAPGALLNKKRLMWAGALVAVYLLAR